jgi:predicted transcriptional regulator
MALVGRKARPEKTGENKVKRGRPSIGKKPTGRKLTTLYKSEGRSVRDIAELLGCSKDMVFRCLKEYQINARTNARRSTLRNYDLSFLEEGINAKGLRGFARELRIDKSALFRHIRVRKTMNYLVS